MIPRFYCPATKVPLAAGRVISLPEEAAHHAAKVLRLRNGDPLVLFDGSSGEFSAHIVETGREMRVMLDEWHAIERESPLKLTLAQALPTGDKMDWIIQKAVELGAAAIQPLQAKRSVVRLAGERAAKRAAHWRQVAVAACEQSGRNRLPDIHAILDLAHYLAQPANGNELRLLLSPHQGERLATLPRPQGSVTLLVGPEAGFDESEEKMVLSTAAGFHAVTLGPRVLRTETAGLAAIAAAMTVWGDY